MSGSSSSTAASVRTTRDSGASSADLTKDGSPYSRLERLVEGLFLGPSSLLNRTPVHDLICAVTAAAERGNGQARGYLKTLLPRFATHPVTGELDGVGIKRFPEQVRRPRAPLTRLFLSPSRRGGRLCGRPRPAKTGAQGRAAPPAEAAQRADPQADPVDLVGRVARDA